MSSRYSEIDKFLEDIDISSKYDERKYLKEILIELDKNFCFILDSSTLKSKLTSYNFLEKCIFNLWHSFSFNQRKLFSDNELPVVPVFINRLYILFNLYKKNMNKIDLENYIDNILILYINNYKSESYNYLKHCIDYIISNGFSVFEKIDDLYSYIANVYNVSDKLVCEKFDNIKRDLIKKMNFELDSDEIKNEDFLFTIYYKFIKENNLLSDKIIKIFDLLYMYQVYPSNKNFKYIFSAIELIECDNNLLQYQEMLYKEVASIYNKSDEFIKSSISDIVKKLYERIPMENRCELFCTDETNKEESLKITNVLNDFCVPKSHKGYKYIFTAMQIIDKNNKLLCSAVDLYQKIADIHNEQWSNIERCIRTTKNKVYDKMNFEMRQKLFLNNRENEKNPSNEEFIFLIYYDLLKQDNKISNDDIKIVEMLYDFHIYFKNSGFIYIFTAIKMLNNDSSLLDAIGNLYSKIGDCYNDCWQNIERCIRKAKEDSYSKLSDQDKDKFFKKKSSKMPQNQEFLSFLYFEFLNRVTKIEEDDKLLIEFLCKLRIYPTYKGFKYLFSALKIFKDNNCFASVQNLYESIADIYSESWQNIERCILKVKESYFEQLDFKDEIIGVSNSEFLEFIFSKFSDQNSNFKENSMVDNLLNEFCISNINMSAKYISSILTILNSNYLLLENINQLYQQVAGMYGCSVENVKYHLDREKKNSYNRMPKYKRDELFFDDTDDKNINLENNDFLSIIYYWFIKKNNLFDSEDMEIFDVLYQFHIYPSKKGFKYILSALKMIKNDSRLLNLPTELYNKISSLYNSNIKNINSCIELVKHKSYNSLSIPKREELFCENISNIDIDNLKNDEFLFILYYHFVKQSNVVNSDVKIFKLLCDFDILPSDKSFKYLFLGVRFLINDKDKIKSTTELYRKIGSIYNKEWYDIEYIVRMGKSINRGVKKDLVFDDLINKKVKEKVFL